MLRLPPFTYHEPRTLSQALKLKEEAGESGMYIAGGTDLLPNMKRRHQEPGVVISLAGIRRLHRIREEGKGEKGKGKGERQKGKGKGERGTVVGAMVTLTELAAHRRIRKHYRALARAAELVSTPQLRNMGTFGGNLCLDTIRRRRREVLVTDPATLEHIGIEQVGSNIYGFPAAAQNYLRLI